MPLSKQNLARFDAVSDINVKFMRTINSGSKKTYDRLMKAHKDRKGRSRLSFDPMKPGELYFSFDSIATLTNRKAGTGLSLAMRIGEKPEKCGVTLSVFETKRIRGHTPFCVVVRCTLTHEGKEDWDCALKGECWTPIGDLVEIGQQAMKGKVFTERLALTFLEDFLMSVDKDL